MFMEISGGTNKEYARIAKKNKHGFNTAIILFELFFLIIER